MSQPPKIVIIFIVLAVVVLAVAGFFGFKYYQTQRQLNLLQSDPNLSQKANQAEVASLVQKVSQLIDLPQGETPTVATVTDVSKLKDQAFFQSAQNGDKVLIYTNAKKAFLYDPNANKIVDVAPVNIGSSSAQPSPAPLNLVLENGTTTSDLDSKVALNISKAYPDLIVVGKINAKNNYDKTVIVPLNDNAKNTATALAGTLNAQVGTLPKGEAQPQNADIVVFVGKDQI